MRIETDHSILNNVRKVHTLMLNSIDKEVIVTPGNIFLFREPVTKIETSWRIAMEYMAEGNTFGTCTFTCTYNEYQAAKKAFDAIGTQIKVQDSEWINKEFEEAIRNA